MKKSSQKQRNTYLNPMRFGIIINHYPVQYPPEAETDIIKYLQEQNPKITSRELRSALEKIRECLSILIGLLPSKEVSGEEIDGLAQKFFDMLWNSKIFLTDKQKESLKTLIKDLFPPKPISKKVLEAKIIKITKKIITELTIVPAEGTILSIQENNINLWLTKNEDEFNKLFLNNIKIDDYKDPLTAKRTKSAVRFQKLYKAIGHLQKELNDIPYRDIAQLTKELRWSLSLSQPKIKSYEKLEAWLKENKQKIIKLAEEEKSLKKENQTPEVKAKLEKNNKQWKKLLNQPIGNEKLPVPTIPNSTITLQTIEGSLYRLKTICGKLKDNPGMSGNAYPTLHMIIRELAYIYKRYTEKEPDRSKTGFPKFIDLVILPIITPKDSLTNIVRKVIELYKKETEIIPPKKIATLINKSKIIQREIGPKKSKLCRNCRELIPEESEFTKLGLAKETAKLGYCSVCIANPKIYLKAQEENPQQ